MGTLVLNPTLPAIRSPIVLTAPFSIASASLSSWASFNCTVRHSQESGKNCKECTEVRYRPAGAFIFESFTCGGRTAISARWRFHISKRCTTCKTCQFRVRAGLHHSGGADTSRLFVHQLGQRPQREGSAATPQTPRQEPAQNPYDKTMLSSNPVWYRNSKRLELRYQTGLLLTLALIAPGETSIHRMRHFTVTYF